MTELCHPYPGPGRGLAKLRKGSEHTFLTGILILIVILIVMLIVILIVILIVPSSRLGSLCVCNGDTYGALS